MSNGRMIVNNELGRIWKEAAMDHGVTFLIWVVLDVMAFSWHSLALHISTQSKFTSLCHLYEGIKYKFCSKQAGMVGPTLTLHQSWQDSFGPAQQVSLAPNPVFRPLYLQVQVLCKHFFITLLQTVAAWIPSGCRFYQKNSVFITHCPSGEFSVNEVQSSGTWEQK